MSNRYIEFMRLRKAYSKLAVKPHDARVPKIIIVWLCLTAAWLAGSACLPMEASAQSPPLFRDNAPAAVPSLTKSSSALNIATTSDPDAIAVLNQLLEASGGKQRWSTIRSATLRVRIGNPESGDSVERLYMDDWSGSEVRYRRSAIGARKSPKDHDGHDHYVVRTQLGNRVIPEFDQAHLLAGNLPAAAASVILSNSNYVVKTARGPRCSVGIACIDVYLKSAGAYVRQEEWLISQTTNLPQTIDLILPSLFSNRITIEEFVFATFDSREGVVVPALGTITPPGGRALPTHLTRIDLNTGFDKVKFDAEAQQR